MENNIYNRDLSNSDKFSIVCEKCKCNTINLVPHRELWCSSIIDVLLVCNNCGNEENIYTHY